MADDKKDAIVIGPLASSGADNYIDELNSKDRGVLQPWEQREKVQEGVEPKAPAFSLNPHDARNEDYLHSGGVFESQNRVLAKENTSAIDMAKAAYNETWILPAILSLTEGDPDFDEELGFQEKYNKNQIEWEYDLPQYQREELRTSKSEEEVRYKLEEIKQQNENYATVMRFGNGVGMATLLAVGSVDPVPLIAGGLATKAAQLARAGTIGRAAVMWDNVGGQVIGNLAGGAVIDASGRHYTYADYVIDGTVGLVAGSVAARIQLSAGLHKEALDINSRIYGEAQKRAGNNATPEDVMAAADSYVKKEVDDLKPRPDEDFEPMMPEVNEEKMFDDELPMMQVDELDEGFEEITLGLPEEMKAEFDAAAVARTEPVNVTVQESLTPDIVIEKDWGTARSWLDRVEKEGTTSQKELAKYLRDNMEGDYAVDKIPALNKKGEKNQSYYQRGTQRLGFRENIKPDIVLHEISHALTVERLIYGSKHPDTHLGKLHTDLEEIRQLALTKFPDAAGANKHYLSNIREFVAGLHSDDKMFIAKLRSIKDPKTGQPITTKIVNIFRAILGIPKANTDAYLRALDLTDQLLKQKVKVHVDGRPDLTRYKEAADDLDYAPNTRLNRQDVLLGKQADSERMFNTADNMQLNPDGSLPNPQDFFMPQADRDLALDEAGISEWNVSNSTERAYLGEILAKAKQWASNNPIDPNRQSITRQVEWVASSGSILANSKNPVARMVAGVLLESASGLAGRRRTAATTKHLLERQYMEAAGELEQAYKWYRQAHGGSVIKDIESVQTRQQFYEAVDAEVQRRGQTTQPAYGIHESITKAADVLEKGYTLQAQDMIHAKVPGYKNLPTNSRGYTRRAIDKGWLLSSTEAQRTALAQGMAKQLSGGVFGNKGWDDPEFAKKIAVKYLERAYSEAHGAVEIPAHLDSPEAAGLVRDVLRAQGLPDADVEKFLSKLSRGGMKTNKKRLALDVTEEFTLPDGSTFRIGDAMDKNVLRLYQQAARSVSGEGALVTHGVPGRAGMQLMRKALMFNGKGESPASLKAELRAFDQITAEFYGTPMASEGHSKVLDNLRILTAASRLGGMAFNAFAETANAAGVIGWEGVRAGIKEMPRIISDLRAGRVDPLLESLYDLAGPVGRDHEIIIPFQDINDTRLITGDMLNGLDRAIRAGAQALPWFNGFHYVLAAQQRSMLKQIVTKSMKAIRDGNNDAALRDMGISDELLQKMRAELPNIATFDAEGRLASLDLRNAEDAMATGDYLTAMRRGTNQIIQGTFIGEQGYWAHNEQLRLLTQFRSYSLVAMEKQWSRQRATFGAEKSMGLFLGLAAFAVPLHLARVAMGAVGREDAAEYVASRTTPSAMGRAILNYVSLSGLAGDVLDVSYGVATGDALSGGGRGGQAFSSIGAVVPAAGYIEQGLRAVTQHDPKDTIRLLPGGNLPYVTATLNTMVE
jgi:hypothetical protein